MLSFVAKRLLLLVPTLLGVSILVFGLLRSSGDPIRGLLPADAPYEQIEAKRKELLLDRPVAVQYMHWLSRAVRLDFGITWFSKRPVGPELLRRFPATLELAATTMFIATSLAIFVALFSARKPGGLFDSFGRTTMFLFLAVPAFWLGIELIIIFSRGLGWLPPAGRGHGSVLTWSGLVEHISHLILPAITLGLGTGAILCRILRASLLEALHSDYIRTAHAKGLTERKVLVRHALRNALIPFVTLSGLSIAGLLEGSIIVESIFGWPGIGQWTVEAIKGRESPVVMACVLLAAVTYTLVNLAVDLLYSVIDPRIRAGGGAK